MVKRKSSTAKETAGARSSARNIGIETIIANLARFLVLPAVPLASS
jgi:hypothetical protein